MFKNFDKRHFNLEGLRLDVSAGGVEIFGNSRSVKLEIPEGLNIRLHNSLAYLESVEKVTKPNAKMMIGTFEANFRSAIIGLQKGHKKTIKFTGTKAEVIINGQSMAMKIGLSHPVIKILPDGVSAKIISTASKEIVVEITSFSKELVGKISSELVKMIKNPYVGGVHIEDIENPKQFKKRTQKNA